MCDGLYHAPFGNMPANGILFFNHVPSFFPVSKTSTCRSWKIHMSKGDLADIFLSVYGYSLEICHKHARFSVFLCSTLSAAPPLVVSCARPEICGDLFAYEL